MAGDWSTFVYFLMIVSLILLFILTLAWYFMLKKKKAESPSHINLYFDENFRKIIGEWDLVSRDRVKNFKRDIGSRLSVVGKEITLIEKNRSKLDKKLNGLDIEISKLESL